MVVAAIFILAILVFLLVNNPPSLSKVEHIEKSLSNSFSEVEGIEIFDTQHKYNYEIDAFMFNDQADQVGYSVTRLNDSREEFMFAWPYSNMVKRGHDIYISYTTLKNDNDDSVRLLVVLSSNPELAKIEFTPGGEETQVFEVAANPSMTWVEVPIAHNTADYLFYDHGGNLIQ